MFDNFSPGANSWFIGTFAVVHFVIVSIAGLSPLVVYLMEGAAKRRNNIHLRRLARQLLTIQLELAAVGGILGSGVIVALIGLRPSVITLVLNIFFWFVVLQLIAFIAGLAFQFAYYFTWDKEKSRHRTWGLIGAIMPLIPYVTFSAAAAFINTPGRWPVTGNVWNAVFNPGTIVSLLHRAGAGLSLLGVMIILLHVFKTKKAVGEEKEYHDYAVKWGGRVAARALEAQVVIGIIRYFFVSPEGRSMLMGGSLTFIWTIGIVAGLVGWAVLFFGTRKRMLPGGVYLGAVAIPVLLATGLMGVVRARERGDFSIRDVMTRTDTLVNLPDRYQVSDVPDGAAIYSENCGACHPGLAGDAPALAKSRHPDPTELAQFLRNPGALNIAMPPYTGDDEEMRALISFLLDIPVDQVSLPTSEAASGAAAAEVRISPLTALAWNDLGMHCFMADYSVFQVLPPYNTIWVQTFERGDPPAIATENLEVSYSFPEIQHPELKTNFWEMAPLYGWDLQPGVGLAGFGVSGAMEVKNDHFVAEGVPIVDTTDAGIWNPYPMVDVVVTGADGNKVTDTTNVAPVSSEMRCDLCHSGGPAKELRVTMENILAAHDRNQETQFIALYEGGQPIMCASCHADPALGIMENNVATTNLSQALHAFHADKMDTVGVPENLCQACHPGPMTNCQRGAMRNAGVTCIDCHGGMAEVGAETRMPWVNLPQCESCHTAELKVASTTMIENPNQALTASMDDLYRNRTAHGGVYCAACHGSPHAWYRSSLELDNRQSELWQGSAGYIQACTVCHETQPEEAFWHFR